MVPWLKLPVPWRSMLKLRITSAGLLSGPKPGNSIRMLYCFSRFSKASASSACLPGFVPLIPEDFAFHWCGSGVSAVPASVFTAGWHPSPCITACHWQWASLSGMDSRFDSKPLLHRGRTRNPCSAHLRPLSQPSSQRVRSAPPSRLEQRVGATPAS